VAHSGRLLVGASIEILSAARDSQFSVKIYVFYWSAIHLGDLNYATGKFDEQR
jgi:hypothetical protein